MPGFGSVRERRLWIAVAAAVGAILAALYPLQFVLDALRSRNLLRASIVGLFLVCATVTVGALAQRRAPLRAWLVLAVTGALYAGVALVMEVPQERLHLVEYGALALLVREAVAESVAVRSLAGRARSVDVWTFGAVTLIGWFDEGVQGILPNRVYDLRDVGWNALAAGLALAAAAAMRVAMAGTQRSRERAGE